MIENEDYKMPDYQPYDDEIWVTLKEGNKYMVSNYGRVKHKQRRRCVTPFCLSSGNRLYKIIYRDEHNKKHDKLLGHVVANNFIDNPNGYKYIRYKDGDWYNNVVSNIEWSEVRQEHNKPVIVDDKGRTCTKCQRYKDWGNFCYSIRGIREKHHVCNNCIAKYTQDNYDDIKIKKKIYYYDNYEKVRQRARNYYNNNKEDIGKKRKEYRETNKEVIKERRTSAPTKYILFKDKLTIEEDPKFDRVGDLEVKCAYCREYFKPSYSQTMARVRALNSFNGTDNRLYCSDECKELCPVFNTREHYKGTKNYKHRDIDKAFREQVKERDGYRCQICGGKENLEVHHIIPYSTDETLNSEMGNNITLCLECHKWIHKNIPGCGYKELANKESVA